MWGSGTMGEGESKAYSSRSGSYRGASFFGVASQRRYRLIAFIALSGPTTFCRRFPRLSNRYSCQLWPVANNHDDFFVFRISSDSKTSTQQTHRAAEKFGFTASHARLFTVIFHYYPPSRRSHPLNHHTLPAESTGPKLHSFSFR